MEPEPIEKFNNQKDVRTMMIEALQKFNIKQVDVARETGIHHSTLSLWLQGKVRGHLIRIQQTLTEWLNNLYNNKPRYTTLNKTLDKQYKLKPNALPVNPKYEQQKQQILVPVHLDLELQGKHYKEVFLWNINQPYMKPQDYAKLLVQQNNSLSHFETQISETIKKSIHNYRLYKSKTPQCIKVFELDIQIDNISLKDRFEWDINNDLNSPEEFAWNLCKQLNLNGQFCVKIAHQIRQQIQFYQKTQTDTGIQQNKQLLNLKKKTRKLIESSQQLATTDTSYNINQTNYLRLYPEQQTWQPIMQFLNPNDTKKFQKLQQRKHRYSRRLR